MKIAMIAPLWETVPPKTYGGTEVVVHLLTEQLLRDGHEVTLFACGGTEFPPNPNLEIVHMIHAPMRELGLAGGEAVLHELIMLETVYRRADEFDVIHNHLGHQALPFATQVKTPTLTTLHGVFQPQAILPFFQHFGHLPYVSISDFQRKPAADLNYVATVYHGLALDRYQANEHPAGDYLAFLGRFSPEKGPHHAIDIAKATGKTLIMAGKVDRADVEYFRNEIEPHIDGKQIFHIGEVNLAQKNELLRNAVATLCPVTWPEPFGLVLTESMACGTPVIALRDGSIPEVVTHGVGGFVADTVEAMIAYVGRIDELDRHAIRVLVEERFSVARMTSDYIKVYESLAQPAVNRPFSKAFHAVEGPGSKVLPLPSTGMVVPASTHNPLSVASGKVPATLTKGSTRLGNLG